LQHLQIHTTPDVELVFDAYPAHVRKKLLMLRRLIRDVASEIEEIKTLDECLKWGEPSFVVKKGSTIRIDWKPRTPDQYAMYFKCTSLLVPSFKKAYGDVFKFEGDRAIVFQLNDSIPEVQLRECIAAGLRYHSVKHLPMLGMKE
jgi:hypothetical protein